MRKRVLKSLLSFCLTALLSVAVMLTASVAIDGMWLLGIPDAKDVASVTLTDAEFPGVTRTYTDAENIERTLKLTRFLKYRLFTAAKEDGAPLVTIVWTLRDGATREISASRETVWWREKAYPLKDDGFFINLAEGIFFSSGNSGDL